MDLVNLSLLFKGFRATKAKLRLPSHLRIQEKEKWLITGPNGSGKTTLIKILAGVFDANSDNFLFPRPEKIGLALTHLLLSPHLTVLENLQFSADAFGCDEPAKCVEKSIADWKIEALASRMAGSLSNGQKTLVALARANVHSPSLLLLDEPAAFLDETGMDRLVNFLRTSPQTIVATAQEGVSFASLFDQTLRIS